VLPKPPDSLRVSLELTAIAGSRKSSVSAALSARPGTAYKLDLFGIPGVAAGGFLWTRGPDAGPAKWDLVVFDREEYVEGGGEHVEIGNLGLHEVSVHDLFSWLWGDYFPGDSLRGGTLPEGWAKTGDGTFAYQGGGFAWKAEIDPGTGLPRAAMRADSAFRIEFGAWHAGAGPKAPQRAVPGRARLYRYGEPVLEIKVSSVEDDPAWKRDPFVLRIPQGFKRVDRLRD
jgi:hypothetical protein